MVFDGGNGEVTGLTGGERSGASVTALGAGRGNTKQAEAAHQAHEEHGAPEGEDGHSSAGSRSATGATPDIENAASGSPTNTEH